MKNKQLAYIILGVGAFLLLSQKQRPPYQTGPYNYYPNIPPPPPPRPNTAQAFSDWVSAILNSYGAVADLWQPGGPFYQLPPDQAQAAGNAFWSMLT